MTPERFAELSELAADGSLSAAEDAELGAHIAADPAARAALRQCLREHLQCRAALRMGDRPQLAARIGQLLQARRPSRRQRAARTVLERIEHRRARRLRVLRWGLPALAALLAVALLPLLGRGAAPAADPATPRVVAGEARLAGGILTRAGQELARGATLETAAGTCEIAWPDGTTVRLGAATRVARPDADGQRLTLERGSLAVHAAHREAGDPLRIACPDAEAAIVGTRFDLAVAEGGSVLQVQDGLVRWTRLADGVAGVVGAGQRVAASALPLPRAVLLDARRIAALRQAVATSRAPWASAWASLRRADPGAEGSGWQGALGLALAARLEPDDAQGGALAVAAVQRVRVLVAAPPPGPSGREGAATLIRAAVAADLLRLTPAWQAADGAALDLWLADALPGVVRHQAAAPAAGDRWWGVAASLAVAARAGDTPRMRALFADLRRELAVDLAPGRRERLRPADLVPALLAADIMHASAGACPPPPPAWREVLSAWAGSPDAAGLPLRGAPPWRLPDAPAGVVGGGGWPHPVLTGLAPEDP